MLIRVLLLQAYAIALGLFQMLGGVHTDEAKYLLNIPYPHPPLIRSILSVTEAFPYQELLWRVIFATLIIQSVWFVYDMGKHLKKEQRIVLCGFWVLSSSIVLQTGTIMMAPITALDGLVFLWLFAKQNDGYHFSRSQAGWIALYWLASLFSTYQIVLFLPIVVALFWRMRIYAVLKIAGICIPLFLVALYTLTNPLIPASMIAAGTENSGIEFGAILSQTAKLWLLGGSLVLSTVGTIGILRSKSWPLIGSFLLVIVYIALSTRLYYPILFTPLFIAGVIAYPKMLRKTDGLFACFVVASAYLVFQNMPPLYKTDAEKVMEVIDGSRAGEYILIDGSFGHQWQYESPKPIRKFTTHLMDQAAYIVCMQPCSDLAHFGWRQMENIAPEVWFNTQRATP